MRSHALLSLVLMVVLGTVSANAQSQSRSQSQSQSHSQSQKQADRDAFVGTLMMRGVDGVRQPAVALATDVEIFVSGLVARAQVSGARQTEREASLELLVGEVMPALGG